MNRLRGAILITLRTGLVTMVLGGFLLASIVLATWPTGHRAVALRTGSMGPAVPAGALAIIEGVEPDMIRLGDVVTVRTDSGGLLTHRVVALTLLGGGPAMVLQGDANRSADPTTISLERLVGRVTMVVPAAGYLAWWLSQPGGLAAYVAIVGLLSLAVAVIGRRPGPKRRRHRRLWRSLGRGPFRGPVRVLERGVWLGLDRPVAGLLLIAALFVGGGSTLRSVALFTSTIGIGDNTFSTGTWAASDYRSLGTGDWSAAGTWERFNGLSWVSATRSPVGSDGIITVRAGHVVTVDVSTAADQVVVASGGQITVATSVTLTIDDGTGSDLDVSGTVDVVGTLTIAASADIALGSGGVLQDSGTVNGAGTILGLSGTIRASGAARTIPNAIAFSTGLIVSGTDDLTLTGALTGGGGLTKTGASTLTLASAANSYAGATTVSAGTLRLGAIDAIGAGSAVSVASGGVLDLSGFDLTVGSLAGAGSVTSSTAGAVTLTAGGDDTNTTFSGLLEDGSGQLALTKAGTGTLALNGTPNTYLGRTTIAGGILAITSDASLGAVPSAPTAGHLRIDGAQLTTSGTFALDANRGIELIGATTVSVTNTLTVDGQISGSGAVTKAGTGTLILTATNSYTGATTVGSGVLSVSDDTALGTPPGSPSAGHLVIDGATLATTSTFSLAASRGVDLPGTATLSVASGTTLTVVGVVTGPGALVKTSTGTLVLDGVNTYSGPTTLSSGTLSIAADSGLGTPPGSPTPGHLTIGTATLSTTADMTLAAARGMFNTGGTGTISVATGTTLAYAGVIAGTGTLAKAGAGTFEISGTNTYTGLTTVTAGVIRVQDDDALGSTSGGTTVTSGAAIEIDGNGLVIAQPITSLNGTGIGGSGALRSLGNANSWSGTITFGANSTIAVDAGSLTLGNVSLLTRAFTVAADGDVLVGGAVTGTTGSIVKNGNGRLTLGAASTYTGATTVNAGTVRLGATDAIGPSSAVTIAGGATLDLAGFDDTIGSLAGAGRVTDSDAGPGTLTVGGNGVGTGTFSGLIEDGTGQVSLVKVGTGTLTLGSAVNTYTGSTTLGAGVISIAGDAALGAAPGSATPGHLTIDTGTLTTTATFALDPNRGIAVTGVATLSNTATTLTIDGIVAGTGSLTKIGSGTVALGGTNTFAGATTVSAGVVSIAADAGLGTPPSTPTAGHLTIGTATLASTATFTLDARRGITNTGGTGTLSVAPATTLSFAGIIDGTGILAKTSTGTLVLGGANTYIGTTTVSAGVIRVQHALALGSVAGTTTVASGAAIEVDGTGLVIAQPISSLIGTGVGGTGALRNLGNANTWSGAITIGSGNATVASDGGTLTLGAVGGATRTLTVTGVGDTDIRGAIATTSGTLVKTGTGTLTLSAANTYTGVTTISAGTVKLGITDAIGSGSAVTVASGATLDLDGFDDTVGSLAGAGTVTNGGSSLATLTVGGNGVGTGTFSGVLADGSRPLAITKIGTGTLTLSGTASTFTGTMTINAGAISATNDGAFGAPPVSPTPGRIAINGATLTTTATFTLDANRGIAISGAGTLSVTSTLTYGGVIAGSGTLTKIGSGTVALGGVNTYTGATTISAGVVSIDADSGLGAAPGSVTAGHLTIGTATLTANSDMALSATRGIAISGTSTVSVATNMTLTYGGIIAGTGALTKTGTGTLTLAGANTYSGATSVNAGVVGVQHSSALGTTAAGTTVTTGEVIEIDGTGLNIAEALNITGTGVTSGGALRNLAGTNTWSGAITLAGTTTFTSVAGLLTTDTITGTNRALTVNGAGDATINGVISTGTGTLTKAGAGRLTLVAANTYTGVTTISAGVVRVRDSASLGTTASATTIASGAAVEVDGTGLAIAENVTSIIGTGVSGTGALRNLANANTWSGTLTIGSGNATVASDGGTLTLGAVGGAGRTLTVTGAGSTGIGGIIGTTTGALIKTGSGTLTLTAANTYTGVTTISAGRVNIDGSIGAGAVSVAAGATLGGSGTAAGTVSVTGTLAPGSSAGRLTNGALTFVATSTFAVEIGGTTPASGHDQDRASSGGVTIGANVTLSLSPIGGFTPTLGQTFLIVDKVASGAISGTFAGLAQGATINGFLGSGLRAQITYLGGTGNDIVLTVIP